ncbi:slipin family protein [bacterium]|nr:slipin family protein [bacterium]
MKSSNALPVLIFVLIFGCGIAASYLLFDSVSRTASYWTVGGSFLAALLIAASVKVANQWERVVMLRLGKFQGLKGPGLFFIIPVLDTLPYWIDLRVITTSFKAEKTLTKDTVPVDVDAVLFWQVIEPVKTALEVEDYRNAISWASQTALRDVIGKTLLSQMLEGREHLDDELQRIIGNRIASWGIRVLSVEIRDVLIPQGLQSAMSMQAQAERERQARVILGDSERQIAQKFEEAARVYSDNPTALHLRAMNMLYEGLKNNATLIIVPSTAVESMQLGTVAGLAAIQKTIADGAGKTGEERGSRQAQQSGGEGIKG